MRKYDHLGDMIIELADAVKPPERMTVSSAAEKYRVLNNPGSYVGPWKNETTPYLVKPMDTMTSRQYNGCVFVGPAQCGKCLDVDTPIPTPDGFRRMGDMREGDEVFSLDGSVTRVLAVSPVYVGRDCFRLTFDDGSTLVADAAHKWAVCDQWAEDPNGLRVLTTSDLLDSYRIETASGKTRYRYSIPVAAPIEAPEQALTIDPYVLGLWLGDGTSAQAALTVNSEDAKHIEREMQRRGVSCVRYAKAGNTAGTSDRLSLRDGMNTALRESNLLFDKHIPAAYLRASEAQRRDLLRGLMDTDGTVSKNGQVSFSQSNERLALQVAELARTLGLKPIVAEKNPTYTYLGEKRAGKKNFIVKFGLRDAAACFTLPRQIEKHADHAASVTKRPTHTGRRFIRSIEQVESVPVRCIAVDHPSHLFLAGEGMVPTHNTDMFLNFVTYSVVCDPMDMILYQTSNVMARDFSRRRIDRLHRHSPEVGQRLLPASDSDNVFDKHYRSGMILTLSWPSIAELSGRPVGRVYLTDYDRMPMNVDGEGSPFDLGRKRTTTFGSSAMTVAESSPGFAVKDPRWLRRSPHEAPPTEGILALYNRGTRERWHWLCIHCDTAFEPSFDLLKWPDSEDMLEAAEQAQMMCPHCSALISPDYKYEINATRAMWVPENCVLEKGMQLRGNPVRSDMASFWLKGPAATFASWKDLVSRYLLAEQEWHRTGSQEALKSTVNTDQGEPYYLRGMEVERVPDELKERATSHDKHVVPHGSRFLVASADVQKNQWVVQVFAVAPHETQPYRLHVIDRFEIRKSNRRDDDGDVMWVKPGAFVEDWTLLEEQVLARRYPKADGSGELGVAFFGCDSGGKEGVTSNAYEWFRRLRKYGDGAHLRVMLIKGEGRPDAPRTRISYPDSSSYSARKNIASGDVPVLILNSNVLKDELNSMLDRNAEAGATVTWPSWLPDEFFAEMCSEIRSPKGWENPRKARNEAWDLSYYAVGICRHKRVDRINWDNPPSWAAEGTDNPHFHPTPKPGVEPVAKTAKAHYNSLAELGQKLA